MGRELLTRLCDKMARVLPTQAAVQHKVSISISCLSTCRRQCILSRVGGKKQRYHYRSLMFAFTCFSYAVLWDKFTQQASVIVM
mmetsp:Transcript_21588/g.67714  ORF Transcript_21588/g.67714 Transcript_21588/m.67714 type:complete len:84 (+) Transcript_21588:507-758(+)